MTKDKKSRKVVYIFILSLIALFMLVQIVQAAVTQPGTNDDPVVTKSYVDSTVQALKDQINVLESRLTSGGGGSAGFTVATASAGQYVYTGSGTEIIVRSGSTTAVKGDAGGLSDVTSAKDLAGGASISLNHLLISSRDDNRGFHADSQCTFLVRGSYRITGSASGGSQTGGNQVGNNGNSGNSGNTGNNSGQTTAKTAVVNASALNVRATPDTTAAILAKALKGETVTVISNSGDWTKIKTSKGITGWVLGQYLTLN
ncbi:MAG: SH3 domain-containing protein [Bacillota bacterium]|nr:SH3 domain-containing protein [Bacillota bacterium]